MNPSAGSRAAELRTVRVEVAAPYDVHVGAYALASLPELVTSIVAAVTRRSTDWPANRSRRHPAAAK